MFYTLKEEIKSHLKKKHRWSTRTRPAQTAPLHTKAQHAKPTQRTYVRFGLFDIYINIRMHRAISMYICTFKYIHTYGSVMA